MATLTLKKPKIIGDTPLEDILQKFVVMRQARSTRSFKFACFHDSFDAALKEATRLAKDSQTERFLVLQVHGFADWRP
ncbi:hypothetical protein UFOVP499_22 [uncultured Caudovirales phage]|uniref:Uncharacterized protein n=1 Tax=uncultured Caudovirales phage TaxID=2100421 RepID=A0A6J5MJ98_9CAUD|nr:hypothetical protein UFOVP499_22 [uncultured Caudovirales phage]